MSLDMDKLLTALDNEDNAPILELDYTKLAAMKNNMLQQLRLPKEELKELHKKLKMYRYVDELPDLQYGSYIRWIPLKNPAIIKLTNGGFICDIQIKDDGMHIVCKNGMNRLFKLKHAENMIFQKLTQQEQVILSAMNYLNK
jgi:hypothetical protein